jgi:hypothetical protein
MRGAIRLLLSVLLWVCAGTAYAQQSETQLPEAPSAAEQPSTAAVHRPPVVFHKKIFWTLVGVDAASAVADAQTSWNDLQMNPNGHEVNSWLYGRRPNLGRYYATFAAVDGAGCFVGDRLLRSRHRSLRILGWALPGAVVAGHAVAAIHNASERP